MLQERLFATLLFRTNRVVAVLVTQLAPPPPSSLSSVAEIGKVVEGLLHALNSGEKQEL